MIIGFKNTNFVYLRYMQVEVSNKKFMCMDMMSEKGFTL